MKKDKLSRRNFIVKSGMGIAGMSLIPGVLKGNILEETKRIISNRFDQTKKPNIIVIYTDDQNLIDLGCFGGNVLTPNIDSFAKEGVKFTQFHVSSPVCTPSRYSMLTGRYADRSKFLLEKYPTDQPAFIRWNTFIEDGDQTLAHVLRENGYFTGIVGKWHLGPDWEVDGKDQDPNDPNVKDLISYSYNLFRNYILKVSGFDYAESIYGNNMHAIGIPKSMQYHNMEWVTNGALNFIDLNKDNPFFLYMATTLPHIPGPVDSMRADPRITAEGFLDKPLKVQPSRENVFKRVKDAGLPEEAAPFLWLDDGIGAVIKKIDELGLTENTIFVFASDNGGPRGKMTCYEAAANMPAIIKWKGKIKEGITSSELTSNIDVVPTILDLCNIPVPENYKTDGISWKKLIIDEDKLDRNSLYMEVIYSRAIMTKEWKYIAVRFPDDVQKEITPENRKEFSMEGKRDIDRYGAQNEYPAYFDDDQLYYLKDDPEEQNNLAYKPEYAGQLNEMKNLLRIYSKDLPSAFGEFKE
jgi:arylsulfatase A-like enzyme